MAIILRIKRGIGLFRSIFVKYALGYIAIILICLILMNIYPVAKMRTMLYESKREAMQNQAAVISSSLSALAVLTPDEVGKVISLLGEMNLTRIIITDASAKIVFDSSNNEDNIDKYAILPEITSAIAGNTAFYYSVTEEAARSRMAIPVMYKSRTLGAVYLYEYSIEQTELLQALRINLQRISAAVFAASIVLALFFSRLMKARLSSIVGAIKKVAAGQYGHRIAVRGRDELDELSEEFNALADRLQKTEELRQRFVSDASHELKTPLAGIRLLSDSIVQNDNMPPELLREFVADIGTEAERLSRITEKLLKLTRLDINKEENRGQVNIADVVNEAMKMLHTLAADKSVELGCELSDGCIIWANPDDIHQVVFNVVENAIKYNVANGSVRVFLFKKENRAVLIIDDTGIGIPEEDIPHIFDRFYRVDKARNSDVGGSGLGLAIVKDTVEKHKGTITVSRRENGGTRFIISFPIYTAGEVEEND